MTGGLLAVHAHPDDESITMGGTLARYAAQGVPVTLVTATLGEEGELMYGRLAGLAAGAADQLGGYRCAELQAACRAMGVTDHRMLGGLGRFRDSGMAGTASAGHPRAFCRALAGGPDHHEAVAALAAVIAEVRPAVVLTYDSDGGYGHPDHVAAHQVTAAAVQSVQSVQSVPLVGAAPSVPSVGARREPGGDGADGHPGGHGDVGSRGGDGDAAGAGDGKSTAVAGVAGDGRSTAVAGAGALRLLAVVRPRAAFGAALDALWRQPMPAGYRRAEPDTFGFLAADDAIDIAVPVGPWRAARRGAMAAHATQLDVWAGPVDGFALTNLLAQPLLGDECYRVLAGPPVPAGATDLFAGL